jgi:hypothetical protein
MVGNFFLFLGALWGSWMVWAGGILRMIPFLEDMIEPWLRRKYPKVDAWFIASGEALKKNLKMIALLCLLVGCYRAWVFEHKNAETAMYGKDGKSEVWSKYNECDKERAVKSSLVDTYSGELSYQRSRNDGQQDTFNRCILALSNASKPEPLRQTFLMHSIDQDTGKGTHANEIILLTNRTVTPVRMRLACDGEVNSIDAHIQTAQSNVQIAATNQVLDKHQIQFEITSPAWTATTPLLITVYFSENDIGRCGIKPL